jgi:crotonobetainyl-CoA:carnitine CoA-transferase CaiB-like acyl-CoA transferase
MRDTPLRYERAAPTLGQHTDAVLRERLALSEDRIAELKAKGIV